MKLIVNATILDEKPTGLGIYTSNVIKELSMLLKFGDSLIVYTGYPEALDLRGVQIRRVNRFVQPKYGKIAGVIRFLWLQLIFPLRALMEGFSVIYNTTHHGVLFAFRHRQIVTIQHDIDVTFTFPEQHILQYYYFKYIIPFLLRGSSAVITTSRYAMEILKKYYGKSISHCYYAYNSYDMTVFKPEKEAEDSIVLKKYGLEGDYILAVGASYSHKNTGNLLVAFRKVQAKHENIRLCIVGYNSDYLDPLTVGDEYREIIKIPYVPQHEIVMFYRGALCLVFPSFCESFGIPSIEAMASGCPVIVSNQSSFPEICEDAALYCNPHDIDDIADKIIKMLTDQDLKASLVEKGLQRVKRFKWKDTAERIYKILSEASGNT